MLIDIFNWQIPFWVKLAVVAIFAVTLMIAIIPHEVSHGWVALKCGDPSAKLAGRLTVNPMKHLEPMGILSMCLIGVGWAKPVPVNPFNYKNFKKGNFLVSSAGIVTNLILAFVFSCGLFFCAKYIGGGHSFWSVDFNKVNVWLFLLFAFFELAVLINIAFMLFNLLPIFPLDGYNILVSFTKPDNKFMNFMRVNSMWVLLVAIAVLYFTSIFGVVRGGIMDGFDWWWGVVFAWL